MAPTADVLARVEMRVAVHRAKEAAFSRAGKQQAKEYVIDTYVYNVVGPNGKGAVPEATLQAQVDALNAAYATAVAPDLTVGTSADAAGITWRFDLKGIVTVEAGDMCDKEVEKKVKAANRKGGKGALNLYITGAAGRGPGAAGTWGAGAWAGRVG